MRCCATMLLAAALAVVAATAARAQAPYPPPLTPPPPVVVLGTPTPAVPFAGARYSFFQPGVISTGTFYRPDYNGIRLTPPRYLPPGPYFYTAYGPYSPGYYSYYYTPGYFRY